MNLIVIDHGDPSVGIPESQYIVPCPFEKEDAKEIDIQHFKTSIESSYDAYSNGRIASYFEDEIQEMHSIDKVPENFQSSRFYSKYSWLWDMIDELLCNKRNEIVLSFKEGSDDLIGHLSNYYNIENALCVRFSNYKLWPKLYLSRSYAKQIIRITRREQKTN